MQQLDAIVIGAGNGGLVGALNLAKAGQKVLLLEKHNIPGGCATTFIRGRFEFDVALHTLYGIGTEEKKGAVRKIFEALDVYDQIEFVKQDEAFSLNILDKLDMGVPFYNDEFIAFLKEISPAEKDAIDQFQQLVLDITDEFYRLYDELGGEINSDKFPLIFEHGTRPGQDLLDAYFTDPMLKRIYSMLFGYTGISMDKIPFCILAVMYEMNGGHHVKGGAQAISNALVDAFEKCGGAVVYNAEVARIDVADNRVTGVTTVDGRRFEAPAILCNASKIRTYVDLLDEAAVPEETFLDLKVSTPGQSLFDIFIGLDCSPQEVGITHRGAYLIDSSLKPEPFEIKLYNTDSISSVSFACLSFLDPDYCETGTAVIRVSSAKALEPWLHMAPEDYFENKFKLAEKMLDHVDKFFPRLRSHIEELEIATPLTHMRYLGAPGGAIYATAAHFKDLLANKLEVKSPIRGLYFCGCAILIGGFNTTYMSGKAVSDLMLTEMAELG